MVNNKDELKKINFNLICERWGIKEIYLFGSFLTGIIKDESDIDIIVDFFDYSKLTLFVLIDIKEEFEEIFGRKVDLITKKSLNNSKNNIFKNEIYNNSEVLYEIG